jgi:hypothetical protein
MFKNSDAKSQHKRKVKCIPKNHPETNTQNVDDEMKVPKTFVGSIYILVTREFINTGEPIYKVGRTNDISKRVQQYPKGSKLLFSMVCTQILEAENEVLKICRQKFIQRRDIGFEYFECSLSEITDIVYTVVKNINET